MDKTRRIKMRDRSVTSCKDHISQPVQSLGPIWPKSGESFQKCKKTRASEVSRRPKMQALDTILFTNGMDAPDLATVKYFLRFHIPTRHGEIIEKPTADLVNIFAKWFFAGFTGITGTLREDRNKVYKKALRIARDQKA